MASIDYKQEVKLGAQPQVCCLARIYLKIRKFDELQWPGVASHGVMLWAGFEFYSGVAV